MNRTSAAALCFLGILSASQVIAGTTNRIEGSVSSSVPEAKQAGSHSARSDFDTSRNSRKWQWRKITEGDGSSSFSTPVVGADGTVYIASENLYAYRPNGKLKWKLPIYNDQSSPAIARDGTIYSSGGDDGVYLFAISPSGVQKWKREAADVVVAPVIGIDGTIYFCSTDKKLYAWSRAGRLKWSFTAGGPLHGAPAIGANGAVYFGSADHNLYAVSSVGKLKWKFATGGQVFGTPAVGGNGVVYFGSDDHYLYAINPDGTLKWKFETGDSIDSGPAINADGSIYVGSWDGFLYAINSDGKLRWKFDTGNDIFASPAISADGTIYVGSSSWDGKLYALNPDGTLRWTFATDGPILKPPVVGKGGAVYVTTYNAIYGHGLHGTFYAIDSGRQVAHSSVHPTATSTVEPGIDSNESSNSMHGWLSYHDDQSGLSFRYPPSMRVIKRSPQKISELRSYSTFPNNLVSITDLAEGDDFLLYFSLFDNLKPDELIYDYRKNHDSGCGFAYHLQIDGHRALACANCTGVCRWDVHLYEPGRKCEIHVEKPVKMDGKNVPPLSDGAYLDGDFPLLSIIRTVHYEPSKGHAESVKAGELAPH
jgi:outer membrane protein assembly factor BamB